MVTMGLTGRKWSVLVNSIELFSQNGFSKVSMRDIAKVVGIQASSIYNHYPSKERILDTIFDYDEYAHQQMVPYLEQAVAEAGAPGRHPLYCLYMLQMHPDRETRALRNKITAIALQEMYSFPRADDLIRRNLVVTMRRYAKAALVRLRERGRIGEMDVDTFVNLLVNHSFSSAVLATTGEAISTAQWRDGMEYLFSLIPLTQPVTGELPGGMFYYCLEDRWA